MTGQNGQGVTFEIGTEFTNNRITEVGFIIQPELSLQKISTVRLKYVYQLNGFDRAQFYNTISILSNLVTFSAFKNRY